MRRGEGRGRGRGHTADAAGDQLGELAAEIEDDDGVRLAPVGPVARSSDGRRRLERRLEIGLDLGVVGGEDAMTGVRRLSVDGLPAFRLGGVRQVARAPRVVDRPGRRGYAARRWL